MKKRALLIGINQYQTLGKLSFARQDAEAFAETLCDHYGFSSHDINLMTCQVEGTGVAFSRYVELAISDLVKYKDLDLLVFGFWGHGFAPEAGKRYLCGLDTIVDDLERTAISMDLIKAKLSQVGAENTLLVLDCCQNKPTGRSVEAETLSRGEEAELSSLARDIQTARRKESKLTIPTVAVLNSCREGQLAYEWEEREHGIFTAHLLDKMCSEASSVAQLASSIFDPVTQTAMNLHRQEQTPFVVIEGKGDIFLPVAVSLKRPTSSLDNIHITHKSEAGSDSKKILRQEILSDTEDALKLLREKYALKPSFFEKRRDRIQKWRKGAEYDWPEAQYLLGRYEAFNKNYASAVDLIRKAAEQGYAEAQMKMGAYYTRGDLVTKDKAEGAKWWLKAAKQGHAPAQYHLGAYYDRKETHADYVEAFKWYLEAANHGHDLAQVSVGACYSHGDGVSVNKTEAAKWYRKAVEHGGDAAATALEFLSKITEKDEGYHFGDCLLCGRQVRGDMEHAGKMFRESLDGTLKKGNALFCSNCQAFVHDTCANKSFWGGPKCPNCETKLRNTGDGGFSIF